jgi:hypothetical protein
VPGVVVKLTPHSNGQTVVNGIFGAFLKIFPVIGYVVKLEIQTDSHFLSFHPSYMYSKRGDASLYPAGENIPLSTVMQI